MSKTSKNHPEGDGLRILNQFLKKEELDDLIISGYELKKLDESTCSEVIQFYHNQILIASYHPSNTPKNRFKIFHDDLYLKLWGMIRENFKEQIRLVATGYPYEPELNILPTGAKYKFLCALKIYAMNPLLVQILEVEGNPKEELKALLGQDYFDAKEKQGVLL